MTRRQQRPFRCRPAPAHLRARPFRAAKRRSRRRAQRRASCRRRHHRRRTPPRRRRHCRRCRIARCPPSTARPSRSTSRSGTASPPTTRPRSSASPTTTTPARPASTSRRRTRAATSRRSTSSSSRRSTTGRSSCMFPDYTTQQVIDSGALIPTQACVEAAGFDTSPFQPSTIAAYSASGVQWGMPFNVSNPVLYYNRNMFEAAGLDPDRPPQSLEELRQYSQQLVDSGAATYGIAVESGSGSGGGWYIEQWFANMGELYADNGNGRFGARDAGAVRRTEGCRAADVRAVADQRRAGGLRRRQRRRRRPAAEAGRLVGAGGDGARHRRPSSAPSSARSPAGSCRASGPRTSVSAHCPGPFRHRRR